jgi:hypothetical protein
MAQTGKSVYPAAGSIFVTTKPLQTLVKMGVDGVAVKYVFLAGVQKAGFLQRRTERLPSVPSGVNRDLPL